MAGGNRSLGLIEVGRAVAAIVVALHRAASAAAFAGIAAGALFHGLIERPMLHLLRGRFLSRAKDSAQVEASAAGVESERPHPVIMPY